jgi:ubiquinone biosynthesis protein COQ9
MERYFSRKVSIKSPSSATQRHGRARSPKTSKASDAYKIFSRNLLKICPFVRWKEEEIIIKRTFGVEFGTQVCILVLYWVL